MRLDVSSSGLEALFGIDIDPASANEVAKTVDQVWKEQKCNKCNGSGKFVGYSGRIVGNCFACDGKGVKKLQNVVVGASIDVSKIAAAFAAARKNGKKRPTLRLDTFVFSRAPDTGKNPGAIYVNDGEQYLGKVRGDSFFPVRDCSEDQKRRVIEVAVDPAASAKAYGFKTIRCACCGIELTNKVSRELGIGPICAEKYGW